MVLSTSVTANGPVTVDIRGSGNLLSDPASFFNKPLNIDLSVTLDHLEQMEEDGDLYEVDEDGEELLPGHIELYEALLADPDTGKARGIYTGSLFDLAYLMYVLDTPYDGTREEPFAGATGEVWNIVQAMERVFFQEMPMIPTSTLQSATLYASNVVILWPEYSITFGWGAGRYRYLNSDLDFSNGFYNSYEVAYRASQQA
jgi:oligopeptide transport system substrate-binding protein